MPFLELEMAIGLATNPEITDRRALTPLLDGLRRALEPPELVAPIHDRPDRLAVEKALARYAGMLGDEAAFERLNASIGYDDQVALETAYLSGRLSVEYKDA